MTDKPIMSLKKFSEDFAGTMRGGSGLLVGIKDDGARVFMGWPDDMSAVEVEMQPHYEKYVRKPATLEIIIDRLCRKCETQLPENDYRGWGS